MFKRVIFSRFTPKNIITMLYAIDISNLPEKKTMWFIGVEVEQEKSTPPPKKNPGSAPEHALF